MFIVFWNLKLCAIISLAIGLSSSLKSKKDSLKFIVIGDWGGLPILPYKTLVQISVARQMAAISAKMKVDFIISLGDNFYFDGVKSVEDSRFNRTFENVYKNKSLHIPWLILAGNHDHNGNVSAQIAYSNVSNRWIFPDYFYKKSYTLQSKKTVIDIIMIDTVLLCGNMEYFHPYQQPVQSEKEKILAEKYWTWVEDELKKSSANYLIVCGHYPVYSIASHGNTDCLVNRLIPLLEKYRVSAYFSGHDHNIQHIQVPGRKWLVEYFVSGAADFVDVSTKHKKDIPDGSLKFHWGKLFSLGAFAYVEITDSKMTLMFIRSNGDILYTYSFSPRFNSNIFRDML